MPKTRSNAGATGSTTRTATPTAPTTQIVLTVRMTKRNGNNIANLSWTGATSTVDVFRNNVRFTTVTGTSTTQNLGKASGTSTYRVCNAGTTTCSSNVTVSY